MWHCSNNGNKRVKFTDDSIKCCECFIKFENSGNNIAIADDPSHVRRYYSTVINSSLSIILKKNNGKVVKSIGNRVLCYFLNSLDNNEKAFEIIIECVYKIIEKQNNINQELLNNIFLTIKIKSIIPGISQNQFIKKHADKTFVAHSEKIVTLIKASK